MRRILTILVIAVIALWGSGAPVAAAPLTYTVTISQITDNIPLRNPCGLTPGFSVFSLIGCPFFLAETCNGGPGTGTLTFAPCWNNLCGGLCSCGLFPGKNCFQAQVSICSAFGGCAFFAVLDLNDGTFIPMTCAGPSCRAAIHSVAA